MLLRILKSLHLIILYEKMLSHDQSADLLKGILSYCLYNPRFPPYVNTVAGIINQFEPFEGENLLPHQLDCEFLQPFQIPERSCLKEL